MLPVWAGGRGGFVPISCFGEGSVCATPPPAASFVATERVFKRNVATGDGVGAEAGERGARASLDAFCAGKHDGRETASPPPARLVAAAPRRGPGARWEGTATGTDERRGRGQALLARSPPSEVTELMIPFWSTMKRNSMPPMTMRIHQLSSEPSKMIRV